MRNYEFTEKELKQIAKNIAEEICREHPDLQIKGRLPVIVAQSKMDEILDKRGNLTTDIKFGG